MSSIPTAYNGINFRSRAEARWAAFFDFAGWEWDYEPVDLDGYIPDFMLRWKRPLLVEVKGGALEFADLIRHTDKVDQSGWQHGALILGATPERGGCLGLLRYPPWSSEWLRAAPFKCRRCGKSSLRPFPAWMDVCVRCGIAGLRGDGNGEWSPTRDWSDACNATQWMPGVPRIYAPRIQAPR